MPGLSHCSNGRWRSVNKNVVQIILIQRLFSTVLVRFIVSKHGIKKQSRRSSGRWRSVNKNVVQIILIRQKSSMLWVCSTATRADIQKQSRSFEIGRASCRERV